MSTNLHETQLKYPTNDKQDYVVFRAIKHFRYYILKNQTKVIVPHVAIRTLFVQQELWEREGN